MQYLGFALAFVFIGLAAGFMVAASESPVVAAALPVLAGLATAVIAAMGGRINSEDLTKRLEGLRSTLVTTPEKVSERTISAFVDSNKALVTHAHETTRALGALTLCFGVFFIVGLGLGMWSRLASVPVQYFSPLSGPWTIAVDGTKTAMPDSAAAALLWLRLEQQLRAAGVAPDTIGRLYKAHADEASERAKAKAQARPGEAQPPTVLDRADGWNETSANFVELGGGLADGGPVRPPVLYVEPGTTLHRELEELAHMLREINIVEPIDILKSLEERFADEFRSIPQALEDVLRVQLDGAVDELNVRFDETRPNWDRVFGLLDPRVGSGPQGADPGSRLGIEINPAVLETIGRRPGVVMISIEDMPAFAGASWNPGLLDTLPACMSASRFAYSEGGCMFR